MVVAHADESPLTLLRLRRADADVALRRSLVTASMLALTFAVLVLLTRALLGEPAIHTIDVPLWDPPVNRALPPLAPTGDPAPPRPAPSSTQGNVLPVRDVVEDNADRLVPPSTPIDPNAAHDGPPGNGAPVKGAEVLAPPPEPDPKVFTFTDKLPMPLRRVKPDYPPIAQAAGMEGKVVVRMLIDVDGSVRRAEIETSSAMFDDDALKAARQWTFTPALTDDKPVMVWVRVPFDFRLH